MILEEFVELSVDPESIKFTMACHFCSEELFIVI